MISDVLFDAIEEIKKYQKDYPEVYGGMFIKDKIEAVKAVMDCLRCDLDRMVGDRDL